MSALHASSHRIVTALLASPRLAATGVLVVAAVVLLAYLLWSFRREREARRRLEEAARLELDVPPSLHPVIDPDVCIGSGSCLSACPEGDILGIVDGVATLINASHCIGHGRCAAECPVGAIKLVFGSDRRGVELPEVDGGFQTSRPGVYVVGELAGMGLIKNALVQGLQVAAGIRATLPPRAPGHDDLLDVAIVGAGPAGLAAAVGARAAGLSFAVLEQATVGGAVAHYPRQKVVMTAPVVLPYHGTFGRRFMSKEDLVAGFDDIIARAGLKIFENAKVTAIDGADGDFLVSSSRGQVRARRVVLAIGRRGSPRALGVPGEDGANVAYQLIDPAQYGDSRVLVVGGGDSAVEAAITLAERGRGQVTLCHRKPALGRCRPLNKQKLEALLAQGKLRALMSTEIAEVRPDSVSLVSDGGAPWTLPNDFVLACLGGELPTQFLSAVGVSIHRHDGRRAMANPALAGRAAGSARRPALKLAVVGAAIIAALAYVGFDYYRLPRELRYTAAAHALLKPSGSWGHGIGILATLVMLSNFAYSLRKRLPMFKGRASIAPWLRFHVFVGLLSPLTILFHSAFQWGNHLATATYVSLVVVVGTGLVGRYIYAWFRLGEDHAQEVAALRVRVRRTLDRLHPALALPGGELPTDGLERLFTLGTDASRGVAEQSLAGLLLGRPLEGWDLRRGLAAARPRFLDRGSYRMFRREALRLRHLEVNEEFHARFKGLMRTWRMLHVALAVGLLLLIGAHVWISISVGFTWLWS